MKFFVAAIFIFTFVAFAHAFVYATIDEFGDNQDPLIGVVYNGNAGANYEWWTPYYTANNFGGDPHFFFFDTTAALGGQRDNVLGYISESSQNSVAILSVVGDAASIAFPLNYAGGAYFQWDGDDTGGSETAFPGATLNNSPGIGNGESSLISPDNRSIDFTFGGKAIGMTIEINADHEVFYFLDAIDINGVTNTLSFSVDPPSENEAVFFFFQFSDFEDPYPLFDFTHIAGFQVRVWTFADFGDIQTTNQAIDTEFKLLQIFGFLVSGHVVIDCFCDSIPDSLVNDELVNLFIQGNPTSIASTRTDINGNYGFEGLQPGSYTVCLDDQVSSRCPTSPGCIDFTLSDILLDDVTNLDFFYTQSTVLQVPADEDLDCGDCSDPECTGFASATGCGGAPTPITTWQDSVTNDGCTETIRRTWVDPDSNQSGVQIIRLTDREAPFITIPASSVTQTCDSPSTYQAWLTSFGGAAATDCSSFQFSASPNSEPFFCDSENVVFTATDSCGLQSSTSATYTVTDFVSPVFTTPASDDSAECNLKTGSSSLALTQWVNSNGGSIVSDNCASSGQISRSNDFIGFPSSCFDDEIVTFSATDNCGNSAFTTATFTISDNTNPVIVNQAIDSQAQCSTSGADNSAFQSFLANRGGATATDDCITNDSNLIWTNDYTGGQVGGPNTCSDTIPVIFTVTDDCGFSASTSASFTIRDTSNPTFTSTAQNQVAQCDGTGNGSDFNTWLNNNAGATATDACSSVVFSNDNNGQPISCGDATTVTFSVVDTCGNGPILTTATFTIVDNDPPFFVTDPQDDSVECDSSASSSFDLWLSSAAFATISDDCSTNGLTITNDFQGSTLPPGCFATAVVTFFGNDECGNRSNGETATFTISDNTPPVISPPASNQSVQCDLSSNQSDYQNFLNTFGGAMASDVCGTISWSNDAPNNGPNGCSDSEVVTFTANDGCGNIAVTTATFSVTDSTSPTLVSSAADLTVECNGSGNTNDLNNWLSSNGGAAATDNCGAVAFTNNFSALSGGCTSSAFVTFTGCDSCGLCVDSSATFTTTDTRAPVIFPQAQSTSVACDITSNTNQFDDFVESRGGAEATDSCNNDSLTWESSFTQSPFGCDSEDVTFTVTDICGRSASTTATFTIFDSVAPQITTPPADVTFECDGNGNANDYNSWVASQGGLVATDACAITLSVINNAPPTGPVGCGTIPVVFTVEDECGNAASATAVYRIVDTNPPSLTFASDRTVECDLNTNNADLQSWLDSNGGATAFDTCYGSNLSFNNNFIALVAQECGSSAEVTFTASDPCGQSASTTATFTVVDTQAPFITTQASSALFECNVLLNDNEVQSYINTNGGAVATDSCSAFFWDNNFVSAPEECTGPISVTFTATDLCGNFAQTVGSIEIDDTIPPRFTNFPNDRTVLCSDSTDPSQTGSPTPVDDCASNLIASHSDTSIQEPDEKLCPGDTIITRTWFVVDDCGNTFSDNQIIRVTIPVGNCIPTPCPPCDDNVCCESSLEPVPCNPVSCRPVPCITTDCRSVPCLPVTCEGSGQTPIFDDDDDEFVAPPIASPIPQDCEPVYIYVFDDDEYEPNFIPQEETTSSSNVIAVSFMLLFTIAMFIF